MDFPPALPAARPPCHKFCSPRPPKILSFERMFFPRLLATVALTALLSAGLSAKTSSRPRAAAPAEAGPAYKGVIVIDAATGRVLFENHADTGNPPASVTKLMTFLVVQDKIKSGELTLQTPVTVSAEASHIGGSRVYLRQGETFTVDELLYALMVQSANDAAYALAEKAAGSRDAFVALMNAQARALGMTRTEYHSPHGLPPGRGQEPDISTARDIATLCRYLLRNTDILRYTSTRIRDFRPGPHHIQMVNHNHLLGVVTGCDGFKTGYYREAGFSLAATVQRNGRRIIAVILGCPERKRRDALTTELIEKGFTALAALPPPSAVPGAPATNPAPAPAPVAVAPASPVPDDGTPKIIFHVPGK